MHTNTFRPLAACLLACAWVAFAPAASAQSIERVEPISWWVGMRNPSLQLMLYGKDIADLAPAIDYPGVRVERATRTGNPNYLFIDLVLEPQAQPGQFEIRLLRGAETAASYRYELLPRDPNSAEREGFNSSDVMYLITPDRFANGDEGNDTVEGTKEKANRGHSGGRHGGDIQGLSNSLDYLEEMGYTALWLNPVLENDQPAYSYHGYATTDYYQVDARYGTNESYRKLAEEAKGRGIKMIMDMIVNHCGDEHWWIKDLPSHDWLNHQTSLESRNFVISNHRRETLQDPYAAESDRKRHADGWFVPTMPDLNQRNPLLATYLIQNSIWWVEYAHLAGIRMDTYSYPDMQFMAEWTRRMMEEYPNFSIVGEEWSDNPAIVSYWQRGKKNANGYVSDLTSVMDFPMQDALSRAMREEESPYMSGLIRLYRMLANDFLYPAPNELVVFLDNHDMSRYYTQMDEDPALLRLGLAVLLTTRGVPQIYYGTEVLLSNKGTDDHGVIRADFPGGWKGDKVNGFTGEGLSKEAAATRKFVQTLLQWRKNATAVHTGELRHYAPENGIYVFFRYDAQQRVMVVVNKNNKPTSLSLGRFREQLGTAAKGVNVIDGQAFDLSGETIQLPAKAPLVLELE